MRVHYGMRIRAVGRSVLIAGILSLFLAQSCIRTEVTVDVSDTTYVYNRVDELLAGDLDDTVVVAEVRSHLKDDSIGLGTTSRPDNGEVVIIGKSIFWVDPDDAGVHELTDPDEVFPFCAVATVPPSAKKLGLSKGDLHELIRALCRETGEQLLAIKIIGEFDEVKVSVARTIPREGFDFDHPGDYLAYFTEGEASWVMVGFYAVSAGGQKILSVEGHPIHLHGMNEDRSFGGHIQKAAVKKATLFLEPITRLDLENK